MVVIEDSSLSSFLLLCQFLFYTKSLCHTVIAGEHLQAITTEELPEKGQLDFVKAVARALHLRIVLFKNVREDGSFGSAQGIFTGSDGTIYIDVNAGKLKKGLGQATLNYTLSHEITHWLQETSPGEYAILKKFVLNNVFNDANKDFDTIVESKRGTGDSRLSYEDALDEVVADGCEEVLTNSKLLEKLIAEDEGTGKKAIKKAKEIIEAVKKLLPGASHEEAKAQQKYLDELVELWDNALKAAMENQNGSENTESAEDRFQKREDNPEILEFLNDQIESGDYTVTYKAFALIDGKLYPPMASYERDPVTNKFLYENYVDEKGKTKQRKILRGSATAVSVDELDNKDNLPWIASEGKLTQEQIDSKSHKNPTAWQKKYAAELSDGRNPWGFYLGDFSLDKSSGKAVPAAYNPYQHSSDMVLNDQFEEAWNRPEIVVVECRVPNSELNNPYWAPYAKDPTGKHEWKTGPIAGQFNKNLRSVYMSRWIQPVRILSASEVAGKIMDVIKSENNPDLVLYWNNFNPYVLRELEKMGVVTDPTGSPNYRQNMPPRFENTARFELTFDSDVKFSTRDSEKDSIGVTFAEAEKRVAEGESISPENEAKFSKRYDADYMQNAINYWEKHGRKYVTEDALKEAARVRSLIKERLSAPDLIDKLGLPEDIEGNTFIADVSYGGTEENTTICVRSLAAQAFMDLISKQLGRPLTVQDTLIISQEMMNTEEKPECLYCYVATDRKAYREYLGNYLAERDKVMESLKNGTNEKKAYKEFLNGRKDTKNMKHRFEMFKRLVNADNVITGADLSSLEDLFKEDGQLRNDIIDYVAENYGLDAGKLFIANDSKSDKGPRVNKTVKGKAVGVVYIDDLINDPEIGEKAARFSQLFDAEAYAQSASWAKKMISYTAYNNHILKWTNKRIQDFNKHYGLRMYSFSDFSPAFILENMQMITDASVRGLKVLAYTKELEFVEIFAKTGMNINISVFATQTKDGKIVRDGMIGADWDKAIELRKKYPNVGITMVATNDALVDYGLKCEDVDVVIPYHLVRTGQAVADYFNYTNYTDVSSDKKDMAFSEYWDAEDAKAKGKRNPTSVYPSVHQNDIVKYVKAVEKLHLTPRFMSYLKGMDEFLSGKMDEKTFRKMNPYYMKLVNETRRSAAESPTVQPIFDLEAAQKSIDGMDAYFKPIGGNTQAARDATARRVIKAIEAIDQKGTKLSKRDYSYEALTAKEPIQITYFEKFDVPTSGKKVNLSEITKAGKKNATLSSDDKGHTQTTVFIKDLEEDVILGSQGVQHGSLGNITNSSTMSTAEVTAALPEILSNSIAINERNPRESKDGDFSYVLMGYAVRSDGQEYLVRSQIKHYSENKSLLENVEIFNVLKGIKAKKNRNRADEELHR